MFTWCSSILLFIIVLQIVLMAKQERKVDDVHQVTLAPNETKSNKQIL